MFRHLAEQVKRMKSEVNRSGKSSDTVMKSAQVGNFDNVELFLTQS